MLRALILPLALLLAGASCASAPPPAPDYVSPDHGNACPEFQKEHDAALARVDNFEGEPWRTYLAAVETMNRFNCWLKKPVEEKPPSMYVPNTTPGKAFPSECYGGHYDAYEGYTGECN